MSESRPTGDGRTIMDADIRSPFSDCKACGAPLLWATTRRRRKLPLDREPTPAGNVVLHGGYAHILNAGDPEPEPGVDRYTAHFATCPNASEFRRPR